MLTYETEEYFPIIGHQHKRVQDWWPTVAVQDQTVRTRMESNLD